MLESNLPPMEDGEEAIPPVSISTCLKCMYANFYMQPPPRSSSSEEQARLEEKGMYS